MFLLAQTCMHTMQLASFCAFRQICCLVTWHFVKCTSMFEAPGQSFATFDVCAFEMSFLHTLLQHTIDNLSHCLTISALGSICIAKYKPATHKDPKVRLLQRCGWVLWPHAESSFDCPSMTHRNIYRLTINSDQRDTHKMTCFIAHAWHPGYACCSCKLKLPMLRISSGALFASGYTLMAMLLNSSVDSYVAACKQHTLLKSNIR